MDREADAVQDESSDAGERVQCCVAELLRWRGGSSSSGFVTTAEVNKLQEELETLRTEDMHKILHQLRALSSKANDVQVKVEEIANGDQFLSELQERIDAMEVGLAKFKLTQRQQFEGYVLEEKMLEKELAFFGETK